MLHKLSRVRRHKFLNRFASKATVKDQVKTPVDQAQFQVVAKVAQFQAGCGFAASPRGAKRKKIRAVLQKAAVTAVVNDEVLDIRVVIEETLDMFDQLRRREFGIEKVERFGGTEKRMLRSKCSLYKRSGASEGTRYRAPPS